MHDLPARFTRVTKNYGPVEALRGLDLTLGRGELVALLGANGAGKTTAVRALLGLAKPTSGEVRVFGADPRDASSRTRLGAVLQIARVPETLRVREHIDMFSSYYPNPMPMHEVIEAAGLQGLERRKYGELSGGQQKRVLFALGICGNPELLVLDEPTVGLDVESRRALWKQIRAFVARGKSVLLTTHYLAEAESLANRVVVIHRGVVIKEGTPAQIKGEAATLEDAFIDLLEAS
ncbi:MAG TPA: ABC transporter ATP-binding protein [Thermoanaerobaculia bacterium]|jgi:ABC-2 type transport system ATP-binding protein|nr:ABC transporter ATP-binding protein [Thermoanaerobaculia bacterium]